MTKTRFGTATAPILISLILAACTCPAPTAVPTPEPTPCAATCADLNAVWAASDWPAVLDILDQLEANGLICGHDSLANKRYSAYFNYGAVLENAGDIETAIEQYRAALALDGQRQNALDALARLDALPDPTNPACSHGELSSYTPTSPGPFAAAEGNRLVVGGESFYVRGANYYPRHAPWYRFLTDGELDEMVEELDLIAGAGFNTLRVFLWYEPLFTCAPEDAVPNPATFAKLDALVTLASERSLHLIVTLNDLSDLHYRPLYTDWERYDAQTAFIASRYQDEPAILAWDLRNEGDLDYSASGDEGRFERDTVLSWLSHTAEVVRANDDRHLITAGWWGDAAETADAVDILSFHHWTDATELVNRTKALQEKSTKPILIEEVGYPSWGEDGEASQAETLRGVIKTAEESYIAGWLIWTAFDSTPADGLPDDPEHHFGLWRADLTPKPALDTLESVLIRVPEKEQ